MKIEKAIANLLYGSLEMGDSFAELVENVVFNATGE